MVYGAKRVEMLLRKAKNGGERLSGKVGKAYEPRFY